MANSDQSSSFPSDADDPFACFGAELEGEKSQRSRIDAATERKELAVEKVQRQVTRDPLCGVLRYHRGTERSLLVYVENELKSLDHRDSLALEVLKCIDKYSLERHWMMHCGPGMFLVNRLIDSPLRPVDVNSAFFFSLNSQR